MRLIRSVVRSTGCLPVSIDLVMSGACPSSAVRKQSGLFAQREFLARWRDHKQQAHSHAGAIVRDFPLHSIPVY
jgi:hypothetical protein